MVHDLRPHGGGHGHGGERKEAVTSSRQGGPETWTHREKGNVMRAPETTHHGREGAGERTTDGTLTELLSARNVMPYHEINGLVIRDPRQSEDRGVRAAPNARGAAHDARPLEAILLGCEFTIVERAERGGSGGHNTSIGARRKASRRDGASFHVQHDYRAQHIVALETGWRRDRCAASKSPRDQTTPLAS